MSCTRAISGCRVVGRVAAELEMREEVAERELAQVLGREEVGEGLGRGVLLGLGDLRGPLGSVDVGNGPVVAHREDITRRATPHCVPAAGRSPSGRPASAFVMQGGLAVPHEDGGAVGGDPAVAKRMGERERHGDVPLGAVGKRWLRW